MHVQKPNCQTDFKIAICTSYLSLLTYVTKTTVVRFSASYHRHLRHPLLHLSEPSCRIMFFWPFIVAGTLMLTALNPPFTAMLVLRSIPRRSHLQLTGSASLARQVSDAHLLAQSPWVPRSDQHYRSALPAPQHKNTSTALTVSEPVFRTTAGPPIIAPSRTWSLLPEKRDLVLFFLPCYPLRYLALVFCLWGFILRVACWIINRLRVPQPTSPASAFVESLRKEIRGQAFTPSSSFDNSGSSSDDSDEESDIVPAVCGLAVLDGTIFVPKAALDTVPAVPLRLNTLSPLDGQSDEVDVVQALALTDANEEASGFDSEDARVKSGEAPPSCLEIRREEAYDLVPLPAQSIAPSGTAQCRNKPRLPMLLLRRNNEEPSTRSRTRASAGGLGGSGRWSSLRSQANPA
ncbi:hypothetical protein C8T65DRAFT_630987 [Cerioporus squamosus]|nr:hypothetical protein C8T65DRAFT_630987 [Cerioporus squamosus]